MGNVLSFFKFILVNVTNSDVAKAAVFCVFVISFFPSQGFSKISKKAVSLSDDRVVMTHYSKAKDGKPTVVLINGLIYSLDDWQTYVNEMVKDGYGVLLLAYSTQPESLAELKFEKPYFAKRDGLQSVEIQDLVDEVLFVIDSFGIDKFTLQSLSYGSFVGVELARQNIDRVENLILTAPAMKLSNRYQPGFRERHQLYAAQKALKALNPFALPFYDPDETYNYELTKILEMTVGLQKDAFGEKGVDFEDFLDGVIQMVLASKWMDVLDYTDESLPPTHLFLASEEESSLLEDQKRLWSGLKKSGAGKSFTFFKHGYHALTGSAPFITAEQTKKVLKNKLAGEFELDVREFQKKRERAKSQAKTNKIKSQKAQKKPKQNALNLSTPLQCNKVL